MIDIAKLIGDPTAFPVLREWTFLNHAGVAPLPLAVTDAMRQHLDQAQSQGYVGGHWYEDLEKLRKLCAKMINADAREIAFVKNTSEGISIVANGIDWQWGDLIVTTGVEYPANIYPWMEVARARGARLEMVPEQVMPDSSRRTPTEALLQAASDPKCRMVSLSHVEFASGQRHELTTIGNFCRERNIRFCVDAIQSVGVLPVDVKGMKIDYLSADGHKWMLGPEGAGFFYCRRELIEHTRPLMVGWMNVIEPDNYGSYDYTLKSDAGRFECGTYNVIGLLGLYGALKLLDAVGVEVVEARLNYLLDRLAAGVIAKGYEVTSPRQPEFRSGILSFKAHGHSHELIFNKMRANKVEIARREGRLRVSPHFYNTEEQIDRVIDLLPSH